MRHTFTIFNWEMGKIIGNWRKTLAVFLLPAVLLLAAINVFPILMNYLSTGHLQAHPITVVGAPESFEEYIDGNQKASRYAITWLTEEEYQDLYDEEGEEGLHESMKKGQIYIFFNADRKELSGWARMDFDKAVENYYSRLAAGEYPKDIKIRVLVMTEEGSYTSYIQGEQFILDLGKGYSSYLLDNLGKAYLDAGGGGRWETDAFNPFQFVMKNRTNANTGAARTIPCMLILLMYYCIYSLSGETLASARDSGFLTKVYLTPISKQALLVGKALSVILVGVVSAAATYTLMFFSSWLNHNNSAYSMLPFGLFLTGSQLLVCAITLITTAMFMTMLCFGIVFKLRRMEDVVMNLQVPLVLLIFEFFGMMFRPSQTLFAEYLFPMHNSAMLIRDVFLGRASFGACFVTNAINLLLAALLFWRCCEDKDGMSHISQEK